MYVRTERTIIEYGTVKIQHKLHKHIMSIICMDKTISADQTTKKVMQSMQMILKAYLGYDKNNLAKSNNWFRSLATLERCKLVTEQS